MFCYILTNKLWSSFPWLPMYVQRVPCNGDVVAPVIIPDCIVKRGILDKVRMRVILKGIICLLEAWISIILYLWLLSSLRFTFEFGTEVIRYRKSCLQQLTARMSREKYGISLLFCLADLCGHPFCVLHCVSE